MNTISYKTNKDELDRLIKVSLEQEEGKYMD